MRGLFPIKTPERCNVPADLMRSAGRRQIGLEPSWGSWPHLPPHPRRQLITCLPGRDMTLLCRERGGSRHGREHLRVIPVGALCSRPHILSRRGRTGPPPELGGSDMQHSPDQAQWFLLAHKLAKSGRYRNAAEVEAALRSKKPDAALPRNAIVRGLIENTCHRMHSRRGWHS